MDHIEKLLRLVNNGHGVSTDTRSIQVGQIFFALKGENFNGNEYASLALERGAILAVVDEVSEGSTDGDLILVDDVLTSLQYLANRYRQQFDIPVFGITGSNGKTTTKELLYHVLGQQFNVLSTKGNLNNYIGVPLTLLDLRHEHDFAIIEMGASEPGEIADLCEIAEPTAGLVTNVGKAHILGFGSEETIWKTKLAIYEFLEKHGGIQFIPPSIRDHRFFDPSLFKKAEYFDQSKLNGNQFTSVSSLESFPFVKVVPLTQEGKSIEINSQLFGQYNIDNLVNVIKVSDYFGLVPKQIKMGIEGYFPANNRSQLIEDDNNNTIILDAYNANPSSVELALDHFTGLETDNKKVIILGDMLELGEIEEIEHLTVVNHLMSYPEIICIFVGPAFATASSKIDQNCDHFQFFNLTAEAKEWWNNSGLKKSLVLVKGSRGIALEKIFKE